MNDFYIDRLPSDCEYQNTPLFFLSPDDTYDDIEASLQVIDDRWKAEEIQKVINSTLPYGYSDFFEVTDIESNVDGSENWICGFCVYFMKETIYPGEARREQPENHAKLIDGVEALIDFPDRSPSTVLRFYVSPESWEVITKRGLFDREHTQFYKMHYPSEDSQIGTMWRLMVLDDSDYEYAIQTDVAPDEPWIFARITEWGQRDFLKRLSPQRFYLGGEIYISEYRKPDPYVASKEHVLAIHEEGGIYPIPEILNILEFDHITCGGITTIPSKMPKLVPLFCKYLSMCSTLTIFNCESGRWTKLKQNDPLFYGWKGLGPDQNFWRVIKKVIPVRHIVAQLWGERLRDYPQNHYVFRMIKQYEKSGHEFVMDKTEQPVLEFAGRANEFR